MEVAHVITWAKEEKLEKINWLSFDSNHTNYIKAKTVIRQEIIKYRSGGDKLST